MARPPASRGPRRNAQQLLSLYCVPRLSLADGAVVCLLSGAAIYEIISQPPPATSLGALLFLSTGILPSAAGLQKYSLARLATSGTDWDTRFLD